MTPEDESSHPPHVLLDFWYLHPQEEMSLRDAVKQAGGKVQVLIHPFAPLSDSYLFLEPEEREEVRQQLDVVLGLIDTGDPPVFIFEEQGRFDATKVKLLTRSMKNPLYMVKTLDSNPEPLLVRASNQECWQALGSRFTDIGVQVVFLGGKYYWWGGEGRLRGCVAHAQEKFQELGFPATVMREACSAY